MTMHGPNQNQEFTPGVAIASGLAEAVEMIVEEMGPLGLMVTGIEPILEGLKAIGLANRFTIHGMDVILKGFIRQHVTHAPTREFLTEFSDSYFDRLKLLSADPTPKQVEQAKGMGLSKARAKLDELKRKSSAKKPFSVLESLLPTARREALFAWVELIRTNDHHAFDRWEILKERIDTKERIEYMLGRPPGDRIPYLEMVFGGKPTILETIASAARGEETPQTAAIQARVDQANATFKRIGAESRARTQSLRDKYRR